MDSTSTDLPDEVILLKCPTKSVVRFKSVSKPWQSIISDPRFSRTHRIQRSKLPENQNKFLVWARPIHDLTQLTKIYLIRLEDGRFREESSFPYQSRTHFLPVCCCNGLFLLTADPSNHQYLLWNPSVRKRIMIRGLTPQTDPHAFKPNSCPHPRMHHFYHDSITDDHKIVFVYADCYTTYSCKGRSWERMRDLPCDLTLIWPRAFVDGCFYGLSNGEIVCFDDRDGNLHKFGKPDDAKWEVDNLGEVSGRVSLYGSSGDKRKLQLWVMEKNGSCFDKWTFSWRTFIISTEKQEANICLLRPVCLINEDEVGLRARVGGFKALDI